MQLEIIISSKVTSQLCIHCACYSPIASRIVCDHVCLRSAIYRRAPISTHSLISQQYVVGEVMKAN